MVEHVVVMHWQNRENPGILVTVVRYRNLWPGPKMTKISWLQFQVTLLVFGKLPISNFHICGTQCRCHAVEKIGHSRNPCNRSYIVTILAMSENDQNSMVAVPGEFARRRKNAYFQFSYMW